MPGVEERRGALVLLHEIYGLNAHILESAQHYAGLGYDVFVPDMTGKTFGYDESSDAYACFMQTGIEAQSRRVGALIKRLRPRCAHIALAGYSAGASVAWLCADSADGIAGFYGSRIRDYADKAPQCPAWLVFARREEFDADALAAVLNGHPNVTAQVMEAAHGFCDPYAAGYDAAAALLAQQGTDSFLRGIMPPGEPGLVHLCALDS